MQKHFLIHKPYGYLSQFVSNERLAHKKKYLGDLYKVPEGTMAIGRLDEPSEGLLLLTTDGKVSEMVRSRKVEKEYYVQVDGIANREHVTVLSKGVTIGLGKGKYYDTLPCKVKLIAQPEKLPHRSKKIRDERHGPTSWLSITITEGKFRQVRKMCAIVDLPVLRLVRVRVGEMQLSQVPDGGILEVDSFQLD
ncbi:pseudouridine synthase [Wenyingzhuangia sp. IMCC45574]